MHPPTPPVWEGAYQTETLTLKIEYYDEERNHQLDAANHRVCDHSSTHRAWRNELREHVGKRELQRGSLYFFRQNAWKLWEYFVSLAPA